MVRYLRLVRFPLVFTAIADSWAGYFIAHADPEPLRLVMLAAASACFYMAGMVFNDVADRERDRTLHPERPLVAGLIGVRSASALGVVLLAIGLGCSFSAQITTGVTALALCAAILAYDFGLKKVGVLGAVGMATTRALNMGLGLSAGFEVAAVVLGTYVFLLTCLSLLEESPNLRVYAFLSILLAASPQLIRVSSDKLEARVMATVLSLSVFVLTFGVARRIPTAVKWGVMLVIVLDAALVSAYGRLGPGLALLALLPLCVVSSVLLKRAT